jgi:hypothetical protein
MAERTLSELLAAYPANVRALARSTRKFVLALLPKAEESVDPSGPYVSFGDGSGYKGVVCYMTISRSGVKLGMAGGARLADPHRLLQGSGKTARHVPLKTPSDLRQAGLKQLVRRTAAAWRARNR